MKIYYKYDSKFAQKPFELFFEALIIAIVISVLGYMASEDFKKGSGDRSISKCSENIRIIQGAIEKYNLDHKEEEYIRELDDHNMELLIDNNYLKEPIKLPSKNCKYCSKNDLADNGYLYCEYHGGYNEKREWIEGLKEINKREVKKTIQYYSVIIGIVVGVIFFVLNMAFNQKQLKFVGLIIIAVIVLISIVVSFLILILSNTFVQLSLKKLLFGK